MRMLFITSTRIGDAILSTGILSHYIAQHPDIKITVACGSLVAGFFEPIPQVDRVITINKKSWKRHWLSLWHDVVGSPWDIVVDLRNSIVSRLIFSNEKFIFGHHIDNTRHKVEQAAQLIGNVSPTPAPRLWIDKVMAARAANFIPNGGPVLAVGPAANWLGKTWPADNFIELIERITAKGQPMHGWRVAVIAAPGEENQARPVLESLPEHIGIDLIAKTKPMEAAACIARCNFYVGNDSGLMHAAAALNIPTIGLFGPSYPHLYRPWGDHCDYVATDKTFDELIDYEGYTPQTAPSLMTSLKVDDVQKAIEKLIENDHKEACA